MVLASRWFSEQQRVRTTEITEGREERIAKLLVQLRRERPCIDNHLRHPLSVKVWASKGNSPCNCRADIQVIGVPARIWSISEKGDLVKKIVWSQLATYIEWAD